MKKKYLQKVLAVCLMGVMAVGTLTGCGGKAKVKHISVATNDVAGIAGYTAFENTVTLKVPVYDRGQEGIPAIGTGDNYWEGWIQENFGNKYNIKVEFVPITRTAVLESYNLLAADKNLPTFLMEYDFPKQAQWAGDGFLATYDLDEFANIAPTYYQSMVKLDQLKYTKMNDNNFFVLANRPYYNTNYKFVTWYRMDWLRQVGYDHIPATRAEYIDAMTKIQKAGISAHPAGGIMTTGTAGVDQNYAYRQYPTDEKEWAMYGDYAIPSLGWEPNKQLLKRANEDFNLGITDPEYFTIDAATSEANFVNGKNYSYSAYIAADMPVLKSFYATNPNAELAIGIQNNVADTANGSVPAFRSNNPFGMMIGFSAQATSDEVKAAWMYMEWMIQDENLFTLQWGFEGEHFNYVDGLPVSIGDYAGDKKQGFNTNKDYWCVVIESRDAGTIEDMIAADSPKGLPQDFTQDLITNYYNQVAAWEKGWVPADCMFGTQIKAVDEYQQTLLTKYAEYRDKLVMCKPEEFDALYETYTKEYQDAGYKAITDERLKAFEDGKSSRMQ